MNIFYVDSNPNIAAQCLVDKHCVKMILESAQLLSTAHRVLDGEQYVDQTQTGRKVKRWRLNDARENIMYSATHTNHPSAVWCRRSIENYSWLVDHMFALMDEYQYRYEKIHKVKSSGLGFHLQSPPYNLKDWDFTIPPSAMAPEYIISDNPIENYRQYYKRAKIHLHAWKKREKPDWL